MSSFALSRFVQPVAEIARIAKQINPHILIHTDARYAPGEHA